MILVIDNYDSFTYNLVQMVESMGRKVRVFRNDGINICDMERLNPSALFISPGPSVPEKAGISIEAIRHFGPNVPILGICLGHQAIAAAYKGRVVKAGRIIHGKTSPIFHDGETIFNGLPNPFEATRYHSLIVDRAAIPDCLKVSAWTEEGEIMGIKHRTYKMEGVQFHPESILTVEGTRLIENFMTLYCAEGD